MRETFNFEPEPEPKWKKVKWWEAANVLLAFPDADYVKLNITGEWLVASSDLLDDLTTKQFSEIRFSIRDFAEESQ